MNLYKLCPESEQFGYTDIEINGVTDNTKNCAEGFIFVCVKGGHFDGHDAAAEMVKKGAAVIIAEYDTGVGNQILVENTREYFTRLVSRFFGEPTKKMKLIAVTGTNGKSTSIAIIKHIIESFGHKCGSIGTVGYDVCGKVYEAHLTTPLPYELYGYFSEMVNNGAEYCVMEASSQALAQYRIAGELFEVSAFMNLTQDHLDYHKTMEEYFKAKKRLFAMSKTAAICIDDKYGERLAKEINIPVSTFSINDIADYYTVNVVLENSYVSYWLSSADSGKSFPVKFRMCGKHNVSNSVAAAAICEKLGFPLDRCVEYLGTFKGIRGRCEIIYSGEFTVICDYAHTADALEKILTAVREFAHGKIFCLFGAAGERDADKRPAMGETVGKLADYAVLTSDNPRFENPQSIIDEVTVGLEKTHIPYECFIDRYEAIKKVLSLAGKSDIIILCGKGHETYQVLGDNYMHFDEREIVNEIMEMNK